MQMTCPKCHGEMRQYERNSVTIDQCADCRGVFLDRGELERLVDAENAWHGASAAAPAPAPATPGYQAAEPYPPQYQGQQPQYQGGQPQYQGQPQYEGQQPNYGHGGGYQPKKKRKSFLEDLFD